MAAFFALRACVTALRAAALFTGVVIVVVAVAVAVVVAVAESAVVAVPESVAVAVPESVVVVVVAVLVVILLLEPTVLVLVEVVTATTDLTEAFEFSVLALACLVVA